MPLIFFKGCSPKQACLKAFGAPRLFKPLEFKPFEEPVVVAVGVQLALGSANKLPSGRYKVHLIRRGRPAKGFKNLRVGGAEPSTGKISVRQKSCRSEPRKDLMRPAHY